MLHLANTLYNNVDTLPNFWDLVLYILIIQRKTPIEDQVPVVSKFNKLNDYLT